jgi:hypothetical protein
MLHQAYRQREHATMMEHLGDPLAATHERLEAQKLEAAAMDVLKMPEVARPSTTGGEMALYDYPDPADRNVGLHLRDSLDNPTMMAAQASLERYKLLLDIGCVELDQDLAATIQPSNSIERMLAGQLASAHYTALRLLAASLGHTNRIGDLQAPWQREQSVEACRLTNAATRLMASFQDGALALQKLRTGGKQVVVVQHVHVSSGGQAVIGDVTTGGSIPAGGQSKKGGTTPCDELSTPPGVHHDAAPRPAKRRRANKLPCAANGAVACTEAPVQGPLEATSMP